MVGSRSTINAHSNTVATALGTESAIHLMWQQYKTKMTLSSKSLEQSRVGCEAMSLKPTGAI
ncbi:hypothetical protein RV134_350238 [Roseovarius sp. EC-HK134]|nr:hypothetical protein RV134_350238 [Roseovarius sp. EC-HK134]